MPPLFPRSGFGLAIVKAIAEQHDASIGVKSDTNRTQFVVTFKP